MQVSNGEQYQNILYQNIYPIASHNMPSSGLFGGEITETLSKKEEKAVAAALRGNAVELLLREVWILDNFDGILEQIFGGSNEIKLVSLVFDGASKDPFKFEVGSFPGIDTNKKLPIGDGGLALYFSEPDQLPRFIDWRLLVIEDDSDVRNAAKIIHQVQKTANYNGIVEEAVGLVNSTWAAVTKITSSVISLIATAMEQNQDDVISLYAATYTLVFDSLGVGVHDIYHEGHSRVKYEIRATL